MQVLFVYFMKKDLKDNNYIAIADWMLELDLNTRELLTYALIYGFSQDGESCYHGSLEYLGEWLGIDSAHSVRYLKPLVEKGLVEKTEIKMEHQQKMCEYRAKQNRGSVTNNPEVDYLIIQPWMIKNLKLNGKDLLLYALIHGYSRRGSDNYCKYKNEYYAKWLQCRKDHVARQIRQAITKGLIKQEKDGYIAIVPNHNENKQNNSSTQNGSTYTQIGSTKKKGKNTQCGSTFIPKVVDNNISNNLNKYTNISFNNNMDNTYSDVVDNKQIDIKKIESIIFNSVSFKRMIEAGKEAQLEGINASERLIKNIKNQSSKKKALIAKLPDTCIEKLFNFAIDATTNIMHTFNNPDGYIVSKINDLINENIA